MKERESDKTDCFFLLPFIMEKKYNRNEMALPALKLALKTHSHKMFYNKRFCLIQSWRGLKKLEKWQIKRSTNSFEISNFRYD